MCSYENCISTKIRARGLCYKHWSLEQYGPCINGCRQPAKNSKGLCPNCFKRGGKPGRRNEGWVFNTDEQRHCSSCKTVRPVSEFTSHKHRCNICQSEKKARAYQAKRNNIFGWQQWNVVQTALGLCVKCFEPFGEDYHLDHIVPESLGGTLDNENCQVLCSTCNIRKGNRESIDYRVRINND